MNKTLLFFSLLVLMLSYLSAQNFEVVGSGESNANGFYFPDITINGKDSWKKTGIDMYIYWVGAFTNVWAIGPAPADSNFNFGSVLYFANAAFTSTEPPSSGYNQNLGAAPAPTAINPTALPVELISFFVISNDNIVMLNWETATEVNNYGFNVERYTPLVSDIPPLEGGKEGGWITLGFIPGSGNSNAPKSYSFTDEAVNKGLYSYRLKQIDFDGTFEYSNSVEINIGIPSRFELNQNYPNPFNPSTVISYQLAEDDFTTLRIYDILGKEIAVLVDEFQIGGNYDINLNVGTTHELSLPSGIYFYTLISGNFFDTKKMILIR